MCVFFKLYSNIQCTIESPEREMLYSSNYEFQVLLISFRTDRCSNFLDFKASWVLPDIQFLPDIPEMPPGEKFY